jgi:hypothetical protein
MTKEQRDEINRLYAALLNFLSFGYDSEYQKGESAIRQLEKLCSLALKGQPREPKPMINQEGQMKDSTPTESLKPVALEMCRHRKMWIIAGGCWYWCYECGAVRQARHNEAIGPWIKPVGKGGENPADELV